MVRSSENTRSRILAAATKEFADCGVAGARVERIAQVAQCNKQALYLYFGSKDKLFEAVYEAMVIKIMGTVPFEAHDLTGYVLRLRDLYNKEPYIRRLSVWYEMERGNPVELPTVRRSMGSKLKAIREAQCEGLVSACYTPEEILLLILSLARTGLDYEIEGLKYTEQEFKVESIIKAVASLTKV